MTRFFMLENGYYDNILKFPFQKKTDSFAAI